MGQILAGPAIDRTALLSADREERLATLRAYVRGLYTRASREEPPASDEEPLYLESIVATELQMTFEADLGVQISLLDLAEVPGVSGIAEMLDAALGEAPADTDSGSVVPVVVADPASRFEPFGLSDVQHAYWLGRSGLFEFGDVSTHLYLEFASDDFDVERASRVLARLVERHDMLRAVVRSDGRQVVLPEVGDVRVGFEDLSGWDEEAAWERVAEVRQRLSHEVRPADVWPLFEVFAQRLGDGSWRVHLSLDLLIADASSIRIFLDEWALLYADPEGDLPPVGLTFRDYLRAVEQVEGGPAFERARRYWLERVPEFFPAPELPTLPRDPGAVTRFVRREFRLGAEAWGRLRERARAWGVTPSAVLLAAYAQVLAVWAKEPRFTVNVTLGDRLPVHPDVGRVIGDFTSLTLLEIDAGSGQAFGEWVRSVQQRLWADMEHRAFGGVRVLRELARAHGPARASMPVVFTSVLGGGFPLDEQGRLPGFGRLVGGVSQTPQVHLDHQVVETPDGLYATWDAVEGLFPEPMLDEAFAAYEELLHRLADDEEAWTQSEPLLVSSGTALAEEVNRTEAPVPGGLLHEAVAERAAASPDAVAVVSGDVELTYADVVGRARRVGRVLRDLGVRPDELVAVCMEKGWEQVVAVLGVLESGAAYVPVDPALPEERRAHLFNTTRARYVLTQARVRDALSWPDTVQVLAVDGAEPWETVSDEPLQPAQRPDNLAYVIFTSGSTGLPKGVMIEHRAALNTIVDVNRRFGVGSGDRVLAVSSLSFDLSVWDVFGVLIAGGTMVMPRPGTSRDPDHWAELIAAHGVTVWNSVPALFELLVEQQAHAGGRALSGLRLAMLSGDWIPVRLPDRARQINPRLELISLGGATEASIWSIYHRIESVDPSLPSIPYGRPLANQTVDVLDHEFRPRPVHAVGRLYIGGVGLARGYWEDPDKTDAAFVACPRTGRRLYRTGDLGRRLPNGEIEFLGREDFQVKIGGHRIELGEIENTLVAHPAITAAVVNAHGDPKGPRRLVAYITTDLPKDDAEAEARRCAAEKLPEYMVPATIVILDRLPLTANGKVDRAALPDPDQAVAAADTTPPRTPAERLLHTIWSDLLGGRSDLGVHANLFDHGADSLLALRATAQADNHGLHLTLPEVFQHPTIAEQAAVTSGRVRQADQGQVSGPTGMTPSQLWFLSRNLPERHHWNDASFLLSLREPLDLDRLRVALRHVIEHHDGLRLRFREEDGTWRAHIAEARPDDPLPFTVHDLSHLDSRGQRDEVTAICDRLQTTLDLAEGPLLRVAYFDLGERPHCVLFIAHWLAVDHYSGRVVLEDLLSCYEALVPGSDPRLPAKTTSFPEWARLLSEHARSETVLAELDYWTSSARAEPDRVRLDRPEGRNDLASLENIVVRLDHDITEALVRRVQPQLGVDLAEVLSTVLARAVPLHHATGSKRRVLIDLERHGRDLELPGANPARTVGRLSTLAPVLVEVDADAQVDEAARDVARQLRAVPGQGAGYGLLRYLSDDPRARVLAEMPQAELGINYLGQVDEVFVRSDLLSVPRMSYGRQHSEVGDRVRVFDLQAYVVAGRFTLTFGYSRNLHRRDTADEIVAALTQGLTEIAAAADGGRA